MSQANSSKNQLIEKPQQEIIQEFFTIQSEELKIKAIELELEKQKDNNGFNYAQKNLDIQAEDRKHARQISADSKKDFYKLVLYISILIISVVGFAIFYDKDDIAKEIIKAIVFVIAGYLGGFGVGKAKSVDNVTIKNSKG